MVLSGTVLLAACNNPVDFDLRNGLNTGSAAINATDARPQPDAQGVIRYPTYQVAVARPGDTVGSIAARVGVDPATLAQHNALAPDTVLRGGEVIALPQGTGGLATASAAPMAPVATGIQTGAIDVTTLASSAIASAPVSSAPAPSAAVPAAAAPASGSQPAQHRVQRGETAYSIARTYSVSPKALAEWNGLDANLSLREGQVLMIPTGGAAPAATQTAAAAPAAATPAVATPAAAPKPTTSGARFAMPASGSIIRPYQKGKNEGVDIGAPAGSPVVAAADGTVAAITKDTDQVPILVLRHPDNTLTVYAGIDAVAVAKGASVTRGQTVAKIRATNPAFLHFEVRKGFESVDPAPYLQ
ncbi:LysM peptidoglycan-binding domain-containing protein [Falsirhodobacter sp. 1013]|uniref:LysM peptidoglycan-binding domain-containing protein n=1 Tax=Falsirhodobacter sp. 1013 TaxID=3417566 RepID=UPI003EB6E8B4